MNRTCIINPKDLASLGTIFGVWAHPDDETYMAGGVMAAAQMNGQTVYCLTATRGELGIQDESRWPAARLAKIRTNELTQSSRIIGFKNIWMDIADGHCQDSSRIGSKFVLQSIKAVKPDTILSFGPEGLTGHPDHQAVAEWAMIASSKLNIKLYQVVMPTKCYKAYKSKRDHLLKRGYEIQEIFYKIDRPPTAQRNQCDVYLKLSNKLWQKKYKALMAMSSQTGILSQQLGQETFRRIFDTEAFKQFSSIK
jgi:LmbE family N-acetylglucosaminyl deacetylase